MGIKDKNGSGLHFSTRSYPRFGRGIYSENNPPTLVKSSPFYWWFKFLQLNDDYKRTAQNNGIGSCADLYKDFGDIEEIDFKSWWKSHSYLFADEESEYKLRVAKSPADLVDFGIKEAVNVVVPLTWSQKSLKKHFTMLISRLGVEKGKRGPVVANPLAKYSIGRRWNFRAMESAYKVYLIRQQHLERGPKETEKRQHKGEVSSKFKVAWADIAIEADLKVADGMKRGSVKASDAEKRKILTILAKRHYARAEAFIKAAATSSFPLNR